MSLQPEEEQEMLAMFHKASAALLSSGWDADVLQEKIGDIADEMDDEE